MSPKHDQRLTREQLKALDRVMELKSNDLADWLFGKEFATELRRVARGADESKHTEDQQG